jgi:hypothetical protein
MNNLLQTKIYFTKHDLARCEQGRPAILGAICLCGGELFGAKRGDGPAFHDALPESDPHSSKMVPSCEVQLSRRGNPVRNMR